MEEYSDMENDTFDAPGATDATDATPANAQGQQQHQTPPEQPGRSDNEGNHLAKAGILRATSGNGAKRLRTRQESRVTTRAGKSAEAVIKQFASQELRSEKEKMQEWKENVVTSRRGL